MVADEVCSPVENTQNAMTDISKLINEFTQPLQLIATQATDMQAMTDRSRAPPSNSRAASHDWQASRKKLET